MQIFLNTDPFLDKPKPSAMPDWDARRRFGVFFVGVSGLLWPVLCISRSRKGVHVLGALGSESVELDYPESLKSEGVIAFLRRLHGKHGRILVILDNAGAHKSRAMGKYLESTDGEVALLFLPPRTPQHNPIEMLWREIKKAIRTRILTGRAK